MKKAKWKHDLGVTLQVVAGVGIALLFGVALAIPIIIKAELAFAVIDFLNRH